MKLKTIIFLCVCPVFFIMTSCEQNKPVQIGNETLRECGYAISSQLFTVMLPDSINIPVLWEESYSFSVMFISDYSVIVEGDTVAFGVDPFFLLEKERIEMFLSIAEASGDFASIDSLQYLLEDSSAYSSILSPVNGLIEYRVVPDEMIQPNDTIALIKISPPDSIYFLLPEFDQISNSFTVSGATITESGMRFSGFPPIGKIALPEVWEVKSNYIYEDNLNSFLITNFYDTIPVTVIGFTDSTRVLYTSVDLDSIPLLLW